MTAAIAAFVVSLGLSGLIVATARWHGHRSSGGAKGVQRLHDRATPRIGGLALAAGAVVAWAFPPADAAALWGGLCLSLIPAFVAGLTEDLSQRAGIGNRLAATLLSGLLICLTTGATLPLPGLPGGALMVISALLIGGMCNAFNMIDGLNGLAAGSAILLLTGMAAIAAAVGDTGVLVACLAVIGLAAGFLLLNFPTGRLFLGDGGAYALGGLTGGLAVLLSARAPEAAVPTVLLLTYPAAEAGFTIWRRLRRRGGNPTRADRLHLHSLIHRSMARRLARHLRRPLLRNPLATVLILPLPLSSVALALAALHSPWLALPGGLVFIAAYLGAYRRVALIGRRPALRSPVPTRPVPPRIARP